jgi:electron transfer flavoprotein alpha subunit
METILYLAATESDGTLSRHSLEALTAAVNLQKELSGSTLSVGLVGGDIKAAADSLAGCGARILGVSGADFSLSRYASDLAAAEALAKAAKATLILAPSTSRLSRMASALAFRLGGAADSHAIAISGKEGIKITRWFYRQRMEALMSRAARPWVVTVDAGCYSAFSGAGSASLQAVNVSLTGEQKRTSVEGLKSPASGKQTIKPDAKLLFVAGAGWTKKQADGQAHADMAEKLIQGFLDKSQASLGSSKSLVDQGGEGQSVLPFLTHLNQVGQTGSTPRHPKGLATCCHGEEPHVVGWRFINERRAVNLDPNCGWAKGKADVVYVADAFKVIEKVNELL